MTAARHAKFVEKGTRERRQVPSDDYSRCERRTTTARHAKSVETGMRVPERGVSFPVHTQERGSATDYASTHDVGRNQSWVPPRAPQYTSRIEEVRLDRSWPLTWVKIVYRFPVHTATEATSTGEVLTLDVSQKYRTAPEVPSSRTDGSNVVGRGVDPRCRAKIILRTIQQASVQDVSILKGDGCLRKAAARRLEVPRS